MRVCVCLRDWADELPDGTDVLAPGKFISSSGGSLRVKWIFFQIVNNCSKIGLDNKKKNKFFLFPSPIGLNEPSSDYTRVQSTWFNSLWRAGDFYKKKKKKKKKTRTRRKRKKKTFTPLCFPGRMDFRNHRKTYSPPTLRHHHHHPRNITFPK